MAQEKIFINNTPPLPAKCAACNNDFKPGAVAIDFGAQLDYYGAILLCEFCIVNAGKLCGMVPVARLDACINALHVASDELLEANRKNRILESFVAAYFSDPDFSIDSLLASHPDLSLLEELASQQPASSGQTSDSESGITEPATG